MTSELTSSCSCALDFTARTHKTLTHTQLWGGRTKWRNACFRRFIQFSRGFFFFFPPLLGLKSHGGDRGEMLLTVSVCSKLTIPPEVKCHVEGWPEMFWPRRVARQKRKHDGSAQGEGRSNGNSQLLPSHYPMICSHLTPRKKKHTKWSNNMCLLVSPLKKSKAKKKKKARSSSTQCVIHLS